MFGRDHRWLIVVVVILGLGAIGSYIYFYVPWFLQPLGCPWPRGAPVPTGEFTITGDTETGHLTVEYVDGTPLVQEGQSHVDELHIVISESTGVRPIKQSYTWGAVGGEFPINHGDHVTITDAPIAEGNTVRVVYDGQVARAQPAYCPGGAARPVNATLSKTTF
jgi:hypothetical protein